MTMAQKALISRPTLAKVEKGDASVSLGVYAAVLFNLGMNERLADIADVLHDRAGLNLEGQYLPKRIVASRTRR